MSNASSDVLTAVLPGVSTNRMRRTTAISPTTMNGWATRRCARKDSTTVYTISTRIRTRQPRRAGCVPGRRPALRPGGGTPHPVAPPPDDADHDHGDRQHRLDLAGPDEVAGIGEVEPVVGMDPDHPGLDLLLDLLQPQEGLGVRVPVRGRRRRRYVPTARPAPR